MIHNFKGLRTPIVLAEKPPNYFGLCLQGRLKHSKCQELFQELNMFKNIYHNYRQNLTKLIKKGKTD